tara:strand:+ start:150 stop:944 length:795 start_codon:yes stop_codon:yes gene_type:complete
MSVDGKGLAFYYGNGANPYIHEKGEVYPEAIEIIPRFTPEGTRWAADFIWRLRGNFFQDPAQTSELSTAQVGVKIAALRDAYNVNYQDCGFLLDNGDPSVHVLRSQVSNNISGNRVTRRSWDNLSECEYANTRSFSMTVQAVFLMADSNLISFNEGVSKTGTGAATWKVRANWRGEPYKHYLTSKSKVVHIQQGEIVSLGGWFSPPTPYWANEEMQEHRVITQHSPQYHGNGVATHYKMTYKYVFERLGASPLSSGHAGSGYTR